MDRRTFLSSALGAIGMAGGALSGMEIPSGEVLLAAEENAMTATAPEDQPMARADEQVLAWARRPPRLAVPDDPAQVRPWRERVRSGLRSCLGVSLEPPAVRVREIAKWQVDDLMIHRLGVIAGDDLEWEALLIHLAKLREQRPGWLCLHGGQPGGMSAVTGLIDDSPGGEESLAALECDYALQLARRGYVTLSFHFPGFGSRAVRQPMDDGRVEVRELIKLDGIRQNYFLRCILALRQPYLGWCVADAAAALSVLRDAPMVLPDKIGAIGHSMGAVVSSLLAGVDERVRAVALGGRFLPYRAAMRSWPSTMKLIRAVPGLWGLVEWDDIMGAAVPIPQFWAYEIRPGQVGREHPSLGVWKAYQAWDAGANLSIYDDHTDRHRFLGAAVYPWIEKLWPAGA